jgi:hypothetical protein
MRCIAGPSRIPTASLAHHADQICEEATMATITFNTAQQDERVREQVTAAVAAYRAMLDAFVNEPTRRTALEVEQTGPAQPTGTSSPSEKA